MVTVRRPYPRSAPCAVECRGDGNQICALIGENLQEGVAGFGDDLPAALRKLADELEREVGQEPAEVELGRLYGKPLVLKTDDTLLIAAAKEFLADMLQLRRHYVGKVQAE